jgi:hypothetical protein
MQNDGDKFNMMPSCTGGMCQLQISRPTRFISDPLGHIILRKSALYTEYVLMYQSTRVSAFVVFKFDKTLENLQINLCNTDHLCKSFSRELHEASQISRNDPDGLKME